MYSSFPFMKSMKSQVCIFIYIHFFSYRFTMLDQALFLELFLIFQFQIASLPMELKYFIFSRWWWVCYNVPWAQRSTESYWWLKQKKSTKTQWNSCFLRQSKVICTYGQIISSWTPPAVGCSPSSTAQTRCMFLVFYNAV